MLPDSEKKIFLKTLFASPVCHSSVLLKKRVLEQLNYYPENFPYYQDYALWINAMKYGYKICNLKDFLVYVRQHEKSATYKHFQDRHFPEIVELYKLIFKDILKLDISKREVENLYKLYYMIDELEDEDLDNAITTLKRISNILVLALRTSKLRIYTGLIFRICSCNKFYYKQRCHERNKCLLDYLRPLFLYYILVKKFLNIFLKPQLFRNRYFFYMFHTFNKIAKPYFRYYTNKFAVDSLIFLLPTDVISVAKHVLMLKIWKMPILIIYH